ncbi:hypothetical protein ACFFRR_011265 [Megaselia abdita]
MSSVHPRKNVEVHVTLLFYSQTILFLHKQKNIEKTICNLKKKKHSMKQKTLKEVLIKTNYLTKFYKQKDEKLYQFLLTIFLISECGYERKNNTQETASFTRIDNGFERNPNV